MDKDRKKVKIAVMMSSYNGERYIEEQINSILLQEDVDVHLFIRDDGSTDNTKNIINKYVSNVNIDIEYGENLGFQRSFMQLVKKVSEQYDYYAFSDQDDYWKKDKLSHAITVLNEKKERDLYTSALDVVDESLKHQYYNEFSKLRISFGSAISRQRLAGCTMVFTPKLLKMAKRFPIDEHYTIFSHDAVVYFLALLIGSEIYFDTKSFIFFRRHAGTVTEHGKGFWKRIKSVTSIFSKDRAWKYNQIEVLDKYYNQDMTSEVSEYCSIVLDYKKSIVKTFRLAMDRRVRCGISIVDLVNVIGIVLRYY